MKKLLLTLLVAVSALTANAQIYVGGEVGLWRNNKAETTDFTIQPEVGYNLSDHWAIGLNIGYAHSYENYLIDYESVNVSVNGFIAMPYARYTYCEWGIVNLFLDGGFGFNIYKRQDSDKANNAWQVGISPGLSVKVAKNLSFVAHLGFLGYRDSDSVFGNASVSAFGDDGFGFRLSGNDVRFGLYYNF